MEASVKVAKVEQEIAVKPNKATKYNKNGKNF